jgi:thiamine kinase
VTRDEIDSLLRSKGLWRGPVSVRELKGGYLNEVYRVTTGNERMVIKRFAPETTGTLFPNLPSDEVRALSLLGRLEVAPKLLAYWPEALVMAYAYVDGEPWVMGTGDVARLLLRKEMADPDGFRRVACEPAGILAEGDRLFARCEARPSGPRPAVADCPPPDRLSLIHTDLGPGNLIGRGAGLRIIDWQCPAAGDLVEDIYSFLSPGFQILSGHAPLSDLDLSEFWTALARPDLRRRHATLRPYFAWRMAAYCLWRSETRSEAEIRDRYARAYAAEIDHMGRPDES